MPAPCTGRFAPSPTGPLHEGSLLAALASCLDARAQGGRWLLRMEDVDAPRTQAGAADTILRQLEAFGFEWDGEVLWQSTRLDAYRAQLDSLRTLGWAYPCACSRREIADSALRAPDGSLRYPGSCRNGLPAGRSPRAWRCLTDDQPIEWQDEIQGLRQERLSESSGDFILLRADGQFAYQLAVVVDDAWQGVTHVLRGSDLLDSTARQLHLQRLLDLPRPVYAHLPVLTNHAGEKLSKQTLAPAIDPSRAARQLVRALKQLGQRPPLELENETLENVWSWARMNWSLAAVPRQRALPPSQDIPAP